MPKGDAYKRYFTYTSMSNDLAYLIGVYMGDGYAYLRDERYGYFELEVTDIDFLMEVSKCLNNIFNTKTTIKLVKNAKGNQKAKYHIRLCSSEFACWLVEITKKKSVIPDEILNATHSYQRQFLQGLMDSEAYMGERKYNKDGTVRRAPQLYFSVKSNWLIDIKQMFENLGISTSKIHQSAGQGRFRIDYKKYLDIGFNIQRKQEKLEEAVKNYGKRNYKAQTIADKRGKLLRKALGVLIFYNSNSNIVEEIKEEIGSE